MSATHVRAARWVATAAATSVVLTLAVAPGARAASSTVSADVLFSELATAAEVSGGYDRDLFPHWIDADGDGCDTRREVLIRQSALPVELTGGCTIVGGSWISPFHGVTWTDPADVDIDHLVPLAEAWRSGAHAWTTTARRDFANDLDLAVALAAVTDEINAAKGDKDPAGWLPSLDRCGYVVGWVAVKWKWQLAVDPIEHSAIQAVLNADRCGETLLERPVQLIPDLAPSPIVFADASRMTFAKEVSWLAERGVTQGWALAGGGREFRPLEPIMRDQMAAFLHRLAGSPEFTPPTVSPFRDVATDYVFYTEIAWLADSGVSQGWLEPDGSRTYRPFQPVSRDVMAAFLHRFDGATGYLPPSRSLFADIASGTPFYAEMSWLASEGISTGWVAANGTYTYRPYDAVTREQMAAFMYRMVNGGVPPITPPDPPAPPGPPTNPGNSKNCSDFATWRQAQDWYAHYFPYYGDVAGLDGNDDGVACESLPGAPRR